MTCAKRRQQIALWVGNDLSEAEIREVRKHVLECPDCQTYHEEMKCCSEALTVCAESRTPVDMPSIWPTVMAQLETTRQPQGGSIWRRSFGFVAKVAVVVVVLVFVTNYHESLESPNSPTGESAPVTESAKSVSNVGFSLVDSPDMIDDTAVAERSESAQSDEFRVLGKE